MLGTSYLVYHTCYTLCMLYASRGSFTLRSKLWLNDRYGEDNACKCTCASIPPYKDWIYRLAKTCAIFALLTYKLMLTHYFTNNLPDLPYRSHTPDNNVSYSRCPLVVWLAIPDPGHR